MSRRFTSLASAFFMAGFLAACGTPAPTSVPEEVDGLEGRRVQTSATPLPPPRLIDRGIHPDISDGRIAYGCGREICLFDLATDQKRQLTNAVGLQAMPVIDGDHVVYRDQRRDFRDGLKHVDELSLYDLATDSEQLIIRMDWPQNFPRLWARVPGGLKKPPYELAGSILAYESEFRTIGVYDVESRRVDANLWDPRWILTGPTTSREFIAFEVQSPICWIAVVKTSPVTGHGGGKLRFIDLAPGTERGWAGNQSCAHRPHGPSLNGNLVAFEDFAGGGWRLGYAQLFRMGGGTVTTSPLVRHAHTSGDRIVWEDRRNGNWDVYMFDLATGVETRITDDTGPDRNPRIDGDWIVWHRGGNVYVQNLQTTIPVEIDIKPGSESNPVNCRSGRGMLPVAILTTADFDATTVDHASVRLAGAAEAHTRKGEAKRHEEDVDEDGDVDLIFHFRVEDTNLDCDSIEAVLTGETFDGSPIEGTDSLRPVGGP